MTNTKSNPNLLMALRPRGGQEDITGESNPAFTFTFAQNIFFENHKGVLLALKIILKTLLSKEVSFVSDFTKNF